MKKLRFVVLFLLGAVANLTAQRWFETMRSNEGTMLLTQFHYGTYLPGGDFKDRFGLTLGFGGGLELLTEKSFLFGLQGSLLFGQDVKEDVLASLRGSDGLIFNDDIFPADVRLRERGIRLDAVLGKVFRVAKSHRSGWRTTLGVGFFQHKIRVQDDPLGKVSQLHGDYKKGYDRLTNGFSLTEFIGYQNLSENRLLNFTVGLEFTQAWTQSRRSFDFDTRQTDSRKRLDLLWGIRLGWTLPFYIGENPDEIQY